MKTKRLLSILLISTVALTAIGCSNTKKGTDETTTQSTSTEVTKEKAFTTIPENKLVEDFVNGSKLHDKTLLNDGVSYINLYFNDKMDNDLIKKYSLEYDPNKKYKLEDLHSNNSELYEIGINTLYTQFYTNNNQYDSFINTTLGKQAVNYLADVWMNEKSDGYNLSDEFKEKNPKDTFQKYLKENNIKITNITYPSQMTNYTILTGSNMVTAHVTVKGTQNKKTFEEELSVDFYFIPSKDIRTGIKKDDKVSDKDFEIRAVYLNPNEQ